MRNAFILTGILIISAVCACDKKEDPAMGEFQILAPTIDMSQTNHFDEALFCNDWVLFKVENETYIDGDFKEKTDVTRTWTKHGYSFRSDHTMMTSSGDQGGWLYSHNHLMWKCQGYYAYEVVSSTEGELHLRTAIFPSYNETNPGLASVPYFKDKRGEHNFLVLEYKPETK